jgi:hypothetical protein
MQETAIRDMRSVGHLDVSNFLDFEASSGGATERTNRKPSVNFLRNLRPGRTSSPTDLLSRMTAGNPTFAVQRGACGGNHRMQVRMMVGLLVSCMQHHHGRWLKLTRFTQHLVKRLPLLTRSSKQTTALTTYVVNDRL